MAANLPRTILERLAGFDVQIRELRRRITAFAPHIPYPVMTAATMVTPPATTSTTPTTLARLHARKTHPNIWARLYVVVAAGTTGEVSLDAAGVTIAGPLPVGVADSYVVLEGPMPGDPGALVDVDVLARVTTGSGSIGLAVALAEGKES